jgi:hypothetical protein
MSWSKKRSSLPGLYSSGRGSVVETVGGMGLGGVAEEAGIISLGKFVVQGNVGEVLVST